MLQYHHTVLRIVPKCPEMSQNVTKCPLQTHLCPNGLVKVCKGKYIWQQKTKFIPSEFRSHSKDNRYSGVRWLKSSKRKTFSISFSKERRQAGSQISGGTPRNLEHVSASFFLFQFHGFMVSWFDLWRFIIKVNFYIRPPFVKILENGLI